MTLSRLLRHVLMVVIAHVQYWAAHIKRIAEAINHQIAVETFVFPLPGCIDE
jgi:hypothetical protein